MQVTHHTDTQPPSTGKVIAKSLFLGGVLVFCEVIFLLIIVGDIKEKISTRDKVIACGIFMLTLAATLAYGLCNPRECGDGENPEDGTNIRTPTVATGGLFAEANHQATTADPLLSQSQQQPDDRDLTPRR